MKFLLVLDDFYRLDLAAQHKNTSLETIQTAIAQLRENLEKSLSKMGVSKIDTKGVEFNPAFHEAIEQVSGHRTSNKVIEEISPGYLLNGELLRAAKVKVSK